MTIDLKYNIGDTAWVMHNNKPTETIVLGFHLDIPIGEEFIPHGSGGSGELKRAILNPSFYLNTIPVFLQDKEKEIIRNKDGCTLLKRDEIIITQLQYLHKTKQELIESL